jgi:hypothetical protein
MLQSPLWRLTPRPMTTCRHNGQKQGRGKEGALGPAGETGSMTT